MTLIARVSSETGRGIMFPRTIASAEALPTATLLGSIKKYIDAAASTVPKVMIAKSFRTDLVFISVTSFQNIAQKPHSGCGFIFNAYLNARKER